MICLAAMADDRWMGSMKMLSASEPEIMENLDSEIVEKLQRCRYRFYICIQKMLLSKRQAKRHITFLLRW